MCYHEKIYLQLKGPPSHLHFTLYSFGLSSRWLAFLALKIEYLFCWRWETKLSSFQESIAWFLCFWLRNCGLFMIFDGVLIFSLWGWDGWWRTVGNGLSWSRCREVVCLKPTRDGFKACAMWLRKERNLHTILLPTDQSWSLGLPLPRDRWPDFFFFSSLAWGWDVRLQILYHHI